VLIAQATHDDRQHHVGHALERAEVDPAVSGPKSVDRVDQRVRPGQQIAAVFEHDGAERCDPYRLGTAGPVEQRAADGLLQRGDLLAHGRLGVAEPGGRPAERALVHDRGHRGEVSQLDVGHQPERTPLIVGSDRIGYG
jgi:hypothetical protein